MAELLPGDMVARCVVRSDLSPVPRTVELTVRMKDDIEKRLKEGAYFWAGWEVLKYRVIKTQRVKSGMIQGGEEVGAWSVVALLDSCAEIAFRRSKAVIREDALLGEVYRECGASVSIADDIRVARFSCFVGQVPSFYIAQALQEEGACIVLRDKRVSVTRLYDLFKQSPKDSIGQTDTTDKIESEFLERHEIPAFYSVNDDGDIVDGDFSLTRAIAYQPRSDERVLRAMSRVLATRRIISSRMAAQINAGDIIDVAGDKFAVITAAHVSEAQEGITDTSTRLWVGSLNA
jgi:hypothetical protein